MRRHLTKQLHDPGSYRALYSAPPPILGGGEDNDVDWVAGLLSSSGDRSMGGKEAHGIPGRGEEDEYRGRKVQGRVDEAQCGWEEEGRGGQKHRQPGPEHSPGGGV